VKWTLQGPLGDHVSDNASSVRDVIEIKVPRGFNIADVGIVERFSKGRVLLSFPNC
jgi:hypothetical protein